MVAIIGPGGFDRVIFKPATAFRCRFRKIDPDFSRIAGLIHDQLKIDQAKGKMLRIAGRARKDLIVVLRFGRDGLDSNDIAGPVEADTQGFAIACFYTFDILLVRIPGAVSVQICDCYDFLIIRYAVAVAVSSIGLGGERSAGAPFRRRAVIVIMHRLPTIIFVFV